MFERFAERARWVCVRSQEEARLLKHNYIGTEHILLALIAEGEGIAARALARCGITSVENERENVRMRAGEGQEAPAGHIPYTPRAKKVLELTLREALQLGHSYIGTEHLLLALIRQGDGVAAQIITLDHNTPLEEMRQEVITLLHGYVGRKTAQQPVTEPPLPRQLDEIRARLEAVEKMLGLG